MNAEQARAYTNALIQESNVDETYEAIRTACQNKQFQITKYGLSDETIKVFRDLKYSVEPIAGQSGHIIKW